METANFTSRRRASCSQRLSSTELPHFRVLKQLIRLPPCSCSQN